MATLVLGLAVSHTSMLLVDPADLVNYPDNDRKIPLLDRDGRPTSFDAQQALAAGKFDAFVTPENLAARAAEAAAHLDHLSEEAAAAKLGALIIIGDDQHELFLEDNTPSLLVYHGASIPGVPYKAPPGRPEWLVRASTRQYAAQLCDYPVAQELAEHIIGTMMQAGFDVSTSNRLPTGKGESHSIAFVHTQILRDLAVPVVPIFLNAYFPPNQPTPARCYAVGQSIAAAVTSLPADLRVGIIASGGMSHFLVDEDLDQQVFQALRAGDRAALVGIPASKLNSGNSELRNWICVAGALEGLGVAWTGYVPGIRTRAGTGTGLGFAAWRDAFEPLPGEAATAG